MSFRQQCNISILKKSMSRPAFEGLGNGPNSRRRGPAASSDEAGPGLMPSLCECVEALVTQALGRLPCHAYRVSWRAKLAVFCSGEGQKCDVHSPATSLLSRPRPRRCLGKQQSLSSFAVGNRRENGLMRSNKHILMSSCPD